MDNSNSNPVQSYDKENTFVFVILGDKVFDNYPKPKLSIQIILLFQMP